MPEELDQKLRAMIVRSSLAKFGQFADFEVTRSWIC